MSSEDLAKLIQERRQRDRLSQSALARLCGVSAGTIGKLEARTAKPDTRTLIRLARGLGISPEELLRLYRGLPAHGQPIRRGSLTYRLAQLFREEAISWSQLDEALRNHFCDCLRLVIALERQRPHQKR